MKRLVVLAVAGASLALLLVWWGGSFDQQIPLPDSNAERLTLARNALQEGDLETVRRIQDAFDTAPETQDYALVVRGFLALSGGKPNDALRHLARVSPEGDLRFWVLFHSAEALYRLDRFLEAESILLVLSQENPDVADVHRLLGALYFDLGAYTPAIAEMELVAQLDPKDYSPHRLIGIMQQDFDLQAEAEEHFRKALELSPPEHIRHEIQEDLAKTLIMQNQFPEVLDLLADAPPTLKVLCARAEAHWSLQQMETADEILAEASRRYPGQRPVLWLQTRIFTAEKRFDEAKRAAEAILAKNPHDAECRYQLALIYSQLQQPEAADREMALYEESTKLAEKLTQLNLQALGEPRNAELRDELAAVCEELGKRELATMWRKAANDCRQAAALAASRNLSAPNDEDAAPETAP